MSGDLLHRIRAERAQRNKRLPHRETLFGRIAAIVMEYHLDDDFLQKLGESAETGHDRSHALRLDTWKPKEPLHQTLFPLLNEKEYFIAQEIIEKINNPYMFYAHSPDELLLCGMLYECNPSIEPEKLERYHFETLLFHEVATRELRGLQDHLETISDEERSDPEKSSGMEAFLDADKGGGVIRSHIKKLSTFIVKIGKNKRD